MVNFLTQLQAELADVRMTYDFATLHLKRELTQRTSKIDAVYRYIGIVGTTISNSLVTCEFLLKNEFELPYGTGDVDFDGVEDENGNIASIERIADSRAVSSDNPFSIDSITYNTLNPESSLSRQSAYAGSLIATDTAVNTSIRFQSTAVLSDNSIDPTITIAGTGINTTVPTVETLFTYLTTWNRRITGA